MKEPPLCIKIISVVMPAKIKFMMTLNCKAPKPALRVNCTFQPMISKCFTNKCYWKCFTQEQIQVTYQNHGANFKPAHELNSLSLSIYFSYLCLCILMFTSWWLLLHFFPFRPIYKYYIIIAWGYLSIVKTSVCNINYSIFYLTFHWNA